MELSLERPISVARRVISFNSDWRFAKGDQEGAEAADFDDSNWKKGPGGFGTEGTPGAVVGTKWNTSDIWIRRSFELNEKSSDFSLLIHHDEDAQVYINSAPAAELTGFTTSYVIVPIKQAAAKALKKGKNAIAVHCKQTSGGQFIDAGLVQVIEQGPLD